MSCTIYVLKCSNDKYYIGRSNRPLQRIADHFSGKGSKWTSLHKPIEILEQRQKCNYFDEDKVTLEYMNKYGIDNVRGGSYCQITLSDEETKMIEKQLDNANDRCYLCHKKGHFIENCSSSILSKESASNKKSTFYSIVSYVFNSLSYLLSSKPKKKKLLCQRCGRNTHNIDHCYAKTHLRGHLL